MQNVCSWDKIAKTLEVLHLARVGMEKSSLPHHYSMIYFPRWKTCPKGSFMAAHVFCVKLSSHLRVRFDYAAARLRK